jgi:hypothetical protein
MPSIAGGNVVQKNIRRITLTAIIQAIIRDTDGIVQFIAQTPFRLSFLEFQIEFVL